MQVQLFSFAKVGFVFQISLVDDMRLGKIEEPASEVSTVQGRGHLLTLALYIVLLS